MKSYRLILLLLVCQVYAGRLSAQLEDKDVEVLVRTYFSTYQEQDFEKLVGMLHPKSMEGLRNSILVNMPKTSGEIEDKDRDSIEQLLNILSVKSAEEAWALRPEVVYLRGLQHSSKIPAATVLKDVATEIKEVKIEKGTDEFHVDVEVESTFKGRVYAGTTYFIVEHFEGALKVVAMTKTKHQAKDEEDSAKTATAPEPKCNKHTKPESEERPE